MEAGAVSHQDPKDTTSGPESRAAGDSRTPGTGWVTFAGTYLALAGLLNLIWGLTALINGSYFAEDGLLWSSLTTWGWIAIIVSVAQVVAGGLLFARKLGGVVMAIVLATLGVLVNFLSVGAYPVWSSIAIVCNALVLFAVTVHADQFSDD